MKKLLFFIFFICIFFLPNRNVALATDIVYTPVNPSFGGSPANAQWLWNSAEAQNKFREEEQARPTLRKSPMESFTDQLSRRMLSEIAGRVVRTAFGEEELQPGHYVVGDHIIDITTDLAEINVVIRDVRTGNTTTITVPYY